MQCNGKKVELKEVQEKIIASMMKLEEEYEVDCMHADVLEVIVQSINKDCMIIKNSLEKELAL